MHFVTAKGCSHECIFCEYGCFNLFPFIVEMLNESSYLQLVQ